MGLSANVVKKSQEENLIDKPSTENIVANSNL